MKKLSFRFGTKQVNRLLAVLLVAGMPSFAFSQCCGNSDTDSTQAQARPKRTVIVQPVAVQPIQPVVPVTVAQSRPITTTVSYPAVPPPATIN
ncbi:MAG: hypothetical protein IKW74_01585, partial [Thermoguttaceae bacterium]|nr:hypothetical protein [Thermoguttaceae bacterium]